MRSGLQAAGLRQGSVQRFARSVASVGHFGKHFQFRNEFRLLRPTRASSDLWERFPAPFGFGFEFLTRTLFQQGCGLLGLPLLVRSCNEFYLTVKAEKN